VSEDVRGKWKRKVDSRLEVMEWIYVSFVSTHELKGFTGGQTLQFHLLNLRNMEREFRIRKGKDRIG